MIYQSNAVCFLIVSNASHYLIAETYSSTINRIKNETCAFIPGKSISVLHVSLVCTL